MPCPVGRRTPPPSRGTSLPRCTSSADDDPVRSSRGGTRAARGLVRTCAASREGREARRRARGREVRAGGSPVAARRAEGPNLMVVEHVRRRREDGRCCCFSLQTVGDWNNGNDNGGQPRSCAEGRSDRIVWPFPGWWNISDASDRHPGGDVMTYVCIPDGSAGSHFCFRRRPRWKPKQNSKSRQLNGLARSRKDGTLTLHTRP